jgi:hypothetical protein
MSDRKAKKQKQAKDKEPQAAPLPDLDEALTWIGQPVDDAEGHKLGKVTAFYADAESEEPKWLVLRLGRFAGDAAIPFEHTAEGGGRVWAAYDREWIRNSPKLNSGEDLNAGQELQLCEYFGIRVGIGRAAEVADREGGDVTAVYVS